MRFDHLMGLDAVDRLVDALQQMTGKTVSERLERQRAQLQDAMLDCHFALGHSRFAVAGDPDLLVGLTDFLDGLGATTVAAVAPANAPVLARAACEQVQIGDLEDLEKLARTGAAEFVITNSHGVDTARRLGVPLLRAGFPQYDRLGGYQQTWIGYRGARQRLFDLANGLLSLERGEIAPYRSRLSPKPGEPPPSEQALEEKRREPAA